MRSKAQLLPVLCFAFFALNWTWLEKKTKKILISGTVTQTHAYCGGARPNDEILAQLGTPKPLGNKKIYIKSGEVNEFNSKVLLALTTDSNGNFQAKLRPGKYIIVDSTRSDMTYYNTLLKTYKVQTRSYEAIDTLCLKEWYMKPEGAFEVGHIEVKNISVNFVKQCNEYVPCCRFRGPLRE